MPRLPVDEQVQIVRQAGYTAIELVVGPNASLSADALAANERRRIRRLIDDAGLMLPSIAAHAELNAADPVRRTAERARFGENIRLAADLAGREGPPCVVTMAYGKPERHEALREAIAESFADVLDEAERVGVVIALEPHVGQAFDLPEKCVWLLDRVDSPHFRLNLDNSHFELMGRSIAEYVPLLVPYSVHTHLKDQRGRYPDHEFLIPGEGDFDYAAYLRAMRDAAYKGAITVEISVQVQRRPGYDPARAAELSMQTLRRAEAA